MEVEELHVAVDVGCRRHRVAIASARGRMLAEFDVERGVLMVPRGVLMVPDLES
jgi:hypothetical protein